MKMNTLLVLSLACFFGYVVGQYTNECPLMKCKPCSYGYVYDKNGCRTCRCKPNECPLKKCKPCSYGYVYDKNGCRTCRCKPRPCYQIKCLRPCPNGYKKDDRGCQTCTCLDFPSHNSGCNVPKKVGPCEAHMPRYFYNTMTGKCEKFFYGGCQGNSNNFESEAICIGTCVCGPVCAIFCEHGNIPDERGCPTCGCRPRPCPLIKCANPCPGGNGRALDKYGCQTCQCKACLEPKKIGPCRASFPRYYYNKSTRRCEKFSWGGCQPNGNNFKKLAECERSCHA